jgi:hypothetical protein
MKLKLLRGTMNAEDPTTKPTPRPPYLPIDLPTHNIQTSQPYPDGSFVMRLHVHVPPGLLKKVSQILGANGEPVNALQGAVVGIPTVQLVLRTDKLEESAIAQVLAKNESELQGLIDSMTNPTLPLPQEPVNGSGQ